MGCYAICEDTKKRVLTYSREEIEKLGIVYKQIVDGTDINTVNEGGWYRGSGSKLENCPTVADFTMLVMAPSEDVVIKVVFPTVVLNPMGSIDPYIYVSQYVISTGSRLPWAEIGDDKIKLVGTELRIGSATIPGAPYYSVDLSSILPNYEWKERSSGSSGDTTTAMKESVQWLMLYNRSRYVFTTTKDVYVKLWNTSNTVVWTSESIPANSNIYVDYDNASGIATIHAGTERDFMPFLSSFSFAGGYGSLNIGIETTDGTAFGKGNATVTASAYE